MRIDLIQLIKYKENEDELTTVSRNSKVKDD